MAQLETEGKALRVLISAYACEPGMGSDPGVGWNWVRQIARFHEVWVMTRANNRGAIENSLERASLPNVHWIYLDLPRWARFWKKGERGVRLYYYLWQLRAYFIAKKLHREIGFELVHHVTLVNYWMPSFLALLPVPFVWGPVGGGESAPRAFWRSFSPRGKLYEVLRELARNLGQLDPFVRLTARRAAFTLVTTHDTENRVRHIGCRRVAVFSEAGLSTEEIEHLGMTPTRQFGTFRFLSMGRLLHWKGFELGLRAFARFQSRFPETQYWIIGDGPEKKRLEDLTKELGVANSVTFWGTLPRSEALERLARSDVLLHPSLHDSGGWVCLEAMASRRPVICLDLGGPALQVTNDTGIKVPAVSPDQVVSDMVEAMESLALDALRRGRLSQGGRQRVDNCFAWNKKGEWIARLYEEVFAASQDAGGALNSCSSETQFKQVG